jgi:hypothetical protein
MSKWVIRIVITLLCLECIVSSGADQYHARLALAEAALTTDHVAQELLISMADSNVVTLKNTLKSLKANYHVTAVERLPTSEDQFRVQFASSLDLAAIMASQDPDLKIEPNYIMSATSLPTDTYYASEQWYLNNTGQSFHRTANISQAGTAGIDIDWEPVFNQTNLRGDTTIVAILDSGLNANHPDIFPNLWTNPLEPIIDGIDNDANNFVDDVHGWNFINNTNQFSDDLGHGTFAAGLIGSVSDNHGIVGIAPQTSIMPLKVLNAQGNGSTTNVIRAINYAVAHGANVINMSFGGASASTAPLITACNDAKQAGVVLVAAAGNTNESIEDNDFAPANIESVIAVGSIDSNGNKATFSNTGNKLSIVTPGVFLLGTRAHTPQESSTMVLNDGAVAPDGYIVASGTSFSTPMVSAAALLLKEQNANWPASLIQTRLESTARDLGSPGKDNLYGYGLLDIQAALGIPEDAPPTNLPPQITSITNTPSTIINDNQNSTTITVITTDPESASLTVTGSGSSLNQPTISFTRTGTNTYTSEPIHTTVIAGSYNVSLNVSDGFQTVSENTIIQVTQAPVGLTITTPTTDSHYVTTAETVTLGGNTTGPVQEIVINSTPVASYIPGQPQWSSNYSLNLGNNTINVDSYTFDHRLIASNNLIIIRNPVAIESTPTASPTPTFSPTPETSPSPTVTPPPTVEPTITPTSTPTPEPSENNSSSRRSKRRRTSEVIAPTSLADFYDIATNHFAYNQINDLRAKGGIQGVNGFFFPNSSISKGEFLKITLRDAGLVNSSCSQTSSPYPLIESSSMNQELRCAYSYGLLQYEPASFNPNQPISRSQAMVWLVSIRKTPVSTSPLSYFQDVAVSTWSPAINTAYEHQWIQGFQGQFYPNNTLTRAEAAKVIVNSRN